MKTTMIKSAALVLALGMLAGCASTSRMDAAEAAIADLQATADAALKAAKEAETTAEAAMDKADSAMSAASAAQATADECNERCARMSEKAMAK